MNKNPSKNTVSAASEIVHTQAKHVSCQGSEYPYDHPIIYLEIPEENGSSECPYCNKVFILKK